MGGKYPLQPFFSITAKNSSLLWQFFILLLKLLLLEPLRLRYLTEFYPILFSTTTWKNCQRWFFFATIEKVGSTQLRHLFFLHFTRICLHICDYFPHNLPLIGCQRRVRIFLIYGRKIPSNSTEISFFFLQFFQYFLK